MNNVDVPILQAESLWRIMPVHHKGNKILLEDVSFELRRGERLVIVGPSGAGKTTLLRILQRLDEPSRGRLFFCNIPYTDIPPTTLRRKVALVFQEPALFDGSVEDNLRIHERLGYRNSPFTIQNLEEALEAVSLPSGFLSHNAQNLSTGEIKRVAVALALLAEPEVLLLDEPTANLDPTAAAGLLDTLKRLNTAGLTLLAVLHQVGHARKIATRAVLLVGGKIIESAPAEQFFTAPQSELTRYFLRGELK